MTADGHTEGNTDRHMLLQVTGGTQSFNRDLNVVLRDGLSWQHRLRPLEEYSLAERCARRATCVQVYLRAGSPSFRNLPFAVFGCM
eukprot:8953070-Pyramimonas_sp.AAC.1